MYGMHLIKTKISLFKNFQALENQCPEQSKSVKYEFS